MVNAVSTPAFSRNEFRDRAEWIAARRDGIGASESPILFGCSPWGSEFSLFALKRGLIEQDADETEWQRWGNILEEPIAREYARRTGRTLTDHGRYAVLRSATAPHMTATLDRVIDSTSDGRGPGVLEIKNTSTFKGEEWNEESGAPLRVVIQGQHQLAVTGYQWGAFAALVGGNMLRVVEFERDEEFIQILRERCAVFWRAVQENKPPPPDGSKATTEALKRLYARESGETIALPDEAIAWREEVVACKSRIQEEEERVGTLDNLLRAAIGSATTGTLADGSSCTLKTVKGGPVSFVRDDYRRLTWRKGKAK